MATSKKDKSKSLPKGTIGNTALSETPNEPLKCDQLIICTVGELVDKLNKPPTQHAAELTFLCDTGPTTSTSTKRSDSVEEYDAECWCVAMLDPPPEPGQKESPVPPLKTSLDPKGGKTRAPAAPTPKPSLDPKPAPTKTQSPIPALTPPKLGLKRVEVIEPVSEATCYQFPDLELGPGNSNAPKPSLDLRATPSKTRSPKAASKPLLDPKPATSRTRTPAPGLNPSLDPKPVPPRTRSPAPGSKPALASKPAPTRTRSPVPASTPKQGLKHAEEIEPVSEATCLCYQFPDPESDPENREPATLRTRFPTPRPKPLLDSKAIPSKTQSPKAASKPSLNPKPAPQRTQSPAPGLNASLDPKPAPTRIRSPAPVSTPKQGLKSVEVVEPVSEATCVCYQFPDSVSDPEITNGPTLSPKPSKTNPSKPRSPKTASKPSLNPKPARTRSPAPLLDPKPAPQRTRSPAPALDSKLASKRTQSSLPASTPTEPEQANRLSLPLQCDHPLHLHSVPAWISKPTLTETLSANLLEKMSLTEPPPIQKCAITSQCDLALHSKPAPKRTRSPAPTQAPEPELVQEPRFEAISPCDEALHSKPVRGRKRSPMPDPTPALEPVQEPKFETISPCDEALHSKAVRGRKRSPMPDRSPALEVGEEPNFEAISPCDEALHSKPARGRKRSPLPDPTPAPDPVQEPKFEAISPCDETLHSKPLRGRKRSPMPDPTPAPDPVQEPKFEAISPCDETLHSKPLRERKRSPMPDPRPALEPGQESKPEAISPCDEALHSKPARGRKRSPMPDPTPAPDPVQEPKFEAISPCDETLHSKPLRGRKRSPMPAPESVVSPNKQETNENSLPNLDAIEVTSAVDSAFTLCAETENRPQKTCTVETLNFFNSSKHPQCNGSPSTNLGDSERKAKIHTIDELLDSSSDLDIPATQSEEGEHYLPKSASVCFYTKPRVLQRVDEAVSPPLPTSTPIPTSNTISEPERVSNSMPVSPPVSVPTCAPTAKQSPTNKMSNQCPKLIACPDDSGRIDSGLSTPSTSITSVNGISVNHYERLIEELKCPGCASPMKAPIKLCATGHSICHHCTTVLMLCPLCKEPFTDLRSLTVEALCSKAHFRCHNAAAGCQVRLQIDLLDWHEKQCVWKTMKCFMGRVWGGCTWTGQETHWRDHLESEHCDKVFKTNEANLQWNMQGKVQPLAGYYVFEAFGEMFNFYQVYDKDRILFTMTITSTVRERKYNFAYEVEMFNQSNEALSITQRFPVHSEYDQDILLDGTCVTASLADLARFINADKTLSYRVRICEVKSPRVCQVPTKPARKHSVDFNNTNIEGANLKSVPAKIIVKRQPADVKVDEADEEKDIMKEEETSCPEDPEFEAFIEKNWGTPQLNFNRKYLKSSTSKDSTGSSSLSDGSSTSPVSKKHQQQLAEANRPRGKMNNVRASLRNSFNSIKSDIFDLRRPFVKKSEEKKEKSK